MDFSQTPTDPVSAGSAFAGAAAGFAPTALITGATSGIGLAFARRLAREGYGVVLVARDAERLEAVAAELRGQWGVQATCLTADLSTDSGIEAVAGFIESRQVDVLINNAGFGLKTGTLTSDPADLAAMSHVINRAVQTLSAVAAKRMVECGRGGVVNVTSLAALSTMGVYAAEKAAATIFTEDLAVALRGTRVTATAVLPGFVRTEFHQRMGVGWEMPSWLYLDPEFVVDVALRDARAGRVISIPGRKYQFVAGLARFLPRSLVRGASGGFRRTRIRRSQQS